MVTCVYETNFTVVMIFLWLLYIATPLIIRVCAETCNAKDFGRGSVVCVCNSTFCDTLPSVDNLQDGQYVQLTSTKDGLRLHKNTGEISPWSNFYFHYITVDSSKTHQIVKGFGASFTDAAGINIASLSNDAQQLFIESYFGENGSEYSFCRVPIGGTDFSTRPYTYADQPVGSLDLWELQLEDYKYKIPYILKAANMSREKLFLMATPWSSPPWMKLNNDYYGSFLLPGYYKMWADYIMKFFEAYKKHGIDFWGFSLQNEPLTGVGASDINSIAWFPFQLISWLCNDIGPAIRNSEFSDLQIIVHDERRIASLTLLEYFNNPEALSYVDGVAFHWYLDEITPAFFLDVVKSAGERVYFFYSEACEGSVGDEEAVILGSWERAESYASSIIEVLEHGGVGWMDWNMALDINGGPSYIGNLVDSPIIVNSAADEFYKQPMYYALAHFSKYIPRGSVRIDVGVSTFAMFTGVRTVAFKRPDNKTVLIALNTGDSSHGFKISDGTGKNVYVTFDARSLNTILF